MTQGVFVVYMDCMNRKLAKGHALTRAPPPPPAPSRGHKTTPDPLESDDYEDEPLEDRLAKKHRPIEQNKFRVCLFVPARFTATIILNNSLGSYSPNSSLVDGARRQDLTLHPSFFRRRQCICTKWQRSSWTLI